MSSLWSLPSIHDRQPFSVISATGYLLPALVCYYATAILVIRPDTFIPRLFLLPVSLMALVRASCGVDYAFGRLDKQANNQCVMYYGFLISLRILVWTFKSKPLKRQPINASEDDKPTTLNTQKTLIDAMDLCFNLRGIGWNWSRGLKVPEESRDTSSRSAFLRHTFWWTIRDTFLLDLSHYTLQWFSPATFGSTTGGTIFDLSLPPIQRYTRSTMITLLFGFFAYWAIDALYNSCTIIGVLIFKQSPSQWPPLSNKPFLSTSLNEFWTVRWHQIFRDTFVHTGSIPLSLVFGKFGGVIGAFVVSGILHDLGCWTMGRGVDPLRVSGFFIMSGVGCSLEILLKSFTGRRVGGFVGRIWALAWLLFWGSGLVDAWALRGFIGNEFIPTPLRPSTWIFERPPAA